MKRIEFFRHNIDKKDIARANRVLRSVFLTTGEAVEEFEQAFSHYIDLPRTIGLTSCTAALHLSLVALGIGPGDEVITTPMSFCATANAILHAGAKPVFVDIEEDTGNLNAALVEAAITRHTRAIMPVHLYGHMCDMVKIRDIARRYHLHIIEDAAHAIEAERDGFRVGQFADTACFSFYATKNITSGEGGAVSTRRKKTAEILKRLRLHGIDKGASDRYTRHYRHWDMPVLGWKYNMDNIQASLLIGQLHRIEKLWTRRDSLWRLYEDELRGLKKVRTLKTLSGVKHARHLFTIRVPGSKRDALLWTLQDRGVGVAVNYRPIHLLSYYRKSFGYERGSYPVAEAIGRGTISLPLYPSLKKDEVIYIVKILKGALKS